MSKRHQQRFRLTKVLLAILSLAFSPTFNPLTFSTMPCTTNIYKHNTVMIQGRYIPYNLDMLENMHACFLIGS